MREKTRRFLKKVLDTAELDFFVVGALALCLLTWFGLRILGDLLIEWSR